MEEEQAEEEAIFNEDDVAHIIKESVEGALGGQAYQHSKVNQWITHVVEHCLIQLSKMGKPFKYIVNCMIMQNNGAGFQAASSCYWDNFTDGYCAVTWENKSMYCLVTIFGFAV